jgi:hypothetical protein
MVISTPVLVGAAVVLAAIAVVAWLLVRKRRTERLRDRFGPEYDRAVRSTGDPRRAEARLAERAKRVEAFPLRTLSADDRKRFADRWRAVQARFVDDPAGATADGDALIQEVMKARGYPVGDFEQRAADLSVDHAAVVQNYRAARDIALRNRRGEATTEDLRKALVHYRDLFQELLEETAPTMKEVRHG